MKTITALCLLWLAGAGNFLVQAAEEESLSKPSAAQLLEEFKSRKFFWEQFEVAKQIVALHAMSVLPSLESWLDHPDRHVRGNVALIFASLGDTRGFETLRTVLSDRSDRPEGQGIPAASSDSRYHVAPQIRADRYYAAHLFGDLKDARAVPILVPLLNDDDVDYIVPWSLGEIGDPRAIPPLVKMLYNKNPSLRVLAIEPLEKLRTVEALPRLRELLADQERCNFDKMASVSETARQAISVLDAKP